MPPIIIAGSWPNKARLRQPQIYIIVSAMRIVILTTSTTLHQMGGTEVHAETLARSAAAEGHHVTIITTNAPDGRPHEEKDGYGVVYLPGTSFEMGRKDLNAWWTESEKKLSELRRGGLADIVWAENHTAQYYVSRVPPAMRPPVISIMNGPGVRGDIKSRWTQANSLGALIYFLTRSLPQVLFYLLPWYRNISKYSESIVTVSAYCESEISREFPASRGKIKTIFNPVDTLLFSPSAELRRAAREHYGIPAGTQVMAMSGVLHRQKGMHKGIEAFKLIKNTLPEAKLIIAGDGPEMENLKALVSELGLSGSVIFCGSLPNERMSFFYNAADIYLNPTLRQEGLAIVILEAMACGLPCVASLAGGTASAFEDGISGFFTKPGDEQELAAKILILLGNPALVASVGTAARKRAIEVFGVKPVISQYLELSEDLMKASK